jgi:hypothetical protein
VPVRASPWTRRVRDGVDLPGGPAYVKVAYGRSDVKAAPSIETDGELPAEASPGSSSTTDLEYETGAGGEHRLARR